MSKALESGRAFIDGVLAKLPENLREAAKAAFTAPEAVEALTLVGDGVLARSDYSRQSDDLKKQQEALAEDYEKLNTWYETRKADLTELDTLRAARKPADPPKPGDPPVLGLDPSKFVAKDDFFKTMQQEQIAAANYLALQNVLTLQHYERFKEVIDTRELLKDQNLGKQKADGGIYGLQDAYTTKYAEKLTEFQTKAEAERISKLVDAQVAERMKGQPLMPIALKNGAGSPLDLLDSPTPPDASQYSAQAAAEEYARLQALRG